MLRVDAYDAVISPLDHWWATRIRENYMRIKRNVWRQGIVDQWGERKWYKKKKSHVAMRVLSINRRREVGQTLGWRGVSRRTVGRGGGAESCTTQRLDGQCCLGRGG
jgi:hypothetical protein